MSKSMCVCGATNILADDLVPNKTVRVTINHILESTTSSADNAGSTQQLPGNFFELNPESFQFFVLLGFEVRFPDMESARPGIVKAPSPTQSTTSKEGSKGMLLMKDRSEKMEVGLEDEANGGAVTAATMPPPELREQTSQESALAPGEEELEKVMSHDLGLPQEKD